MPLGLGKRQCQTTLLPDEGSLIIESDIHNAATRGKNTFRQLEPENVSLVV